MSNNVEKQLRRNGNGGVRNVDWNLPETTEPQGPICRGLRPKLIISVCVRARS